MTPDRWQEIKDLMAEALDVSAPERVSFVSQRAADDEELCQEVLSLLESHEDAGDFLDSPVVEVDSFLKEEESGSALAGRRIGSYELVREIGRGGMGTVYLALRADSAFRKEVAVKLIRGGMENQFVIRRFRNERQILARLEHPHIARLLDGGTTPEGFPYFVMEFVKGEPLIAHCEARGLDLRRRLEIFLNVCSAVQYAHRRMIIHRDLKPGNVMVTEEGTPKLLDFGIAKILDPDPEDDHTITLTGLRLITPAYGSPEQMRGEPATVRSDLYSLGVVLWELLTGRRCRADDGKLSFDLPRPAEDHPDTLLLRNVRNVVLRAVCENPADRYDSVEAFAADISRALGGDDIPFQGSARMLQYRERPQPGSIAILPFHVFGAEFASEAYLGLGIADALITRISKIGRVAVRPTGAIAKFGNDADALECGRELNVQYVLEGRLRKAEDRVRITVQLVDVQAGTPIWADTFDEPFEDLLKLEDAIAARVAQALIPQMTGDERRELARPGTASAKAHQAYLRGRWYWSQHTEDALPQALVLFTEAVTEDPDYARAHAGVADYHIALGIRGLMLPRESFAAAIVSARRAIDLDPKLAEAHASLGLALWVRDGDFEIAVHHLQLAIALNPDLVAAHDWLGLVNASRRKPDAAISSIERAQQLEPHSRVYAADLAFCHYNARRFREAAAAFDSAASGGGLVTPPPVVNGAILPLTLLALGDRERACASARHFAEDTSRNALALAVLAQAEAAAGDQIRARALRDEINARARDYYVPGVAVAVAELACGRKRQALRALERACRDDDLWTMYLRQMPVWDPLRGDPRFEQLLERYRKTAPTGGRSRNARKPRRGYKSAWVAAAILALAAIAIIVSLQQASAPFQHTRVSKLTTNGLAERAVISPDGRFVAYAAREHGAASIWVRRLAESTSYRLAGPFEGLVPSLQFTKDGAHVAFVVTPVNDPQRAVLHVVPTEGGDDRVAISGASFPGALSPDEAWFASYRTNPGSGADELVIVPASGREAGIQGRVIHTTKHPEVYAETPAPAWSPDGKQIAVAVRGPLASGYGVRLQIVGVNGGVRAIANPVWQNVSAVAWLRQSRGLLVAGQDVDGAFHQVWYVPTGRGAAVRITNDLNDYAAAGVDANESAFVSVVTQTVTNLFVHRAGDFDRPLQVTPGGGRYFDVAWTPGGNLLYASDATGSAEIWSMDLRGNQHQLTSGLGRNYAPAISPDGRTVAFHSNHDGVWNIWKMDAAGGRLAQVTHDRSESQYPQFTPDGNAIVYQRLGDNALYSAWVAPLGAGSPRQLTTLHTMYPAIGPDGRLAVWYCENPADPKWQIAIYAPKGSAPEHVFGFPANRMPNVLLRWMPRGDAITYVETTGGAANLWMQPVAGGPPKRLTSYNSGRIYSFDWSRDGRLAYSRGMTTSDVVLVRDTDKIAIR